MSVRPSPQFGVTKALSAGLEKSFSTDPIWGLPAADAACNRYAKDGSSCVDSRSRARSAPPYRRPMTAPLMQVAMVPARIDLTPSATISWRRSGTIAPMPPIRMPRLPKLANPHIA